MKIRLQCSVVLTRSRLVDIVGTWATFYNTKEGEIASRLVDIAWTTFLLNDLSLYTKDHATRISPLKVITQISELPHKSNYYIIVL